MRQLALGLGAGAPLEGFPVGVRHGHVAPGKAVFGRWPSGRQWQRLRRAGVGRLDDGGGLALAPAAHGSERGDTVVVLVVCRHQVCGDQTGGVQYLPHVAVVDLEEGDAPLLPDAHAFEAERFAARAFVNALRIVVRREQAIGGGVHHLGDELEPFGCEVVALIDHHRVVFVVGDLAALAYEAFMKAAALRRQSPPVVVVS